MHVLSRESPFSLKTINTPESFNLNNLTPILSNKLRNHYRTGHVSERNQYENITKSLHIQIDHAFYFSV